MARAGVNRAPGRAFVCIASYHVPNSQAQNIILDLGIVELIL